MRALLMERFGGPLTVREVPDPTPAPDGVVVAVGASGVCRSDWHAWSGHDSDVVLPHVPGHELAGTVAAVGDRVRRWSVGDRVTVPFVCACGLCPPCREGQHQVCLRQTQPGFTHWGSFAELVALDAADVNLVALPDDLSFATAASLGCRFATAFRAVTGVGRVAPGEWVAVIGCGGVGLSAVNGAALAGASRIIAIDRLQSKLDLARIMGATDTILAGNDDVVAQVKDLTGGGVQYSFEALGLKATAEQSFAMLRPGGTATIIGMIPFGVKIELHGADFLRERKIQGSSMGSNHFRVDMPRLLKLWQQGRLHLDHLISGTLALGEINAGFARLKTGEAVRQLIRFP